MMNVANFRDVFFIAHLLYWSSGDYRIDSCLFYGTKESVGFILLYMFYYILDHHLKSISRNNFLQVLSYCNFYIAICSDFTDNVRFWQLISPRRTTVCCSSSVRSQYLSRSCTRLLYYKWLYNPSTILKDCYPGPVLNLRCSEILLSSSWVTGA